jgi:hypothetical protein
MLALGRHRVIRVVLWLSLTASLWLAASLPSGFGIAQIAMFIGPGIVLAIAASWASHAAFPRVWTWQHGARAAAIGAALFPPFVVLFFAWSGTFGPEVMMTLLVFSAWLAVLCGLMIALARLAMARRPRGRRMFSAGLLAPSSRALTRMARGRSHPLPMTKL